jgi:RHS repeat-associated protein
VSPSANPITYTGQHYDYESGLYYYRSRFYQPQLGEFLRRDPTEYADSLNLYSYCGASPVNYTDPYGTIKIWINSTAKNPTCPITPGGAGGEGSVSWGVELENGAPANGFIVQKVSVRCRYGECCKKDDSGIGIEFLYWEAWRVLQGKTARENYGSWDRASCSPSYCTNGSILQEGKFRFFTNEEMGIDDGDTSSTVPGWTQYNSAPVYYPDKNSPCRMNPGRLSSTAEYPDFWLLEGGSGERAAFRLAEFNWKCCPSNGNCNGDGSNVAKIVDWWPINKNH